jgi:pimeloyl-ACP methyl ester carboxylesterase
LSAVIFSILAFHAYVFAATVAVETVTVVPTSTVVTAPASPIQLCEQVMVQGLERPARNRVEIHPDKSVTYKGQHYNKIVAEPSPYTLGMRYHRVEGLVRPDDQVIMPLLHGMGMNTSHAGAMFFALNMFSAVKAENRTSKKFSVTAFLHEHFPYTKIAAVSFDMAGNNFGTSIEKTPTIDEVVDGIAAEFRYYKSLAPGRPLIPLGRSAGSGILYEINKKYPGLMDGIIVIAPVPPEAEALRIAIQGFYDDTANKTEAYRLKGKEIDFFPNIPVLDWCVRLYKEMTWTKDAKPMGDIPTLVLVGSEDLETPEISRRLYKQYVATNPNAQYVEIQGAAHDVLNILKPKTDQGIESYGTIFNFIAGVLKRSGQH